MSKLLQQTLKVRDRAILVGVEIPHQERQLSLHDSLVELELLAKTADVDVLGKLTQKLTSPNPKTFIGTGKVEELKILVDETNSNLGKYYEILRRFIK